MATPADQPDGRNLADSRAVGLGSVTTRDVSMIEGEVEVREIGALPKERGVTGAPRVRALTAAAGHAIVVSAFYPRRSGDLARGERAPAEI